MVMMIDSEWGTKMYFVRYSKSRNLIESRLTLIEITEQKQVIISLSVR